MLGLYVCIPLRQEFLMQIESRKPVVLSVNLLSKELLSQATPDSRELWDRLSAVNQQWDKVCARASVWQKELQIALVQCQDFSKTVADLMLWIQTMETEIQRQEPVDVTAPHDVLSKKYRKFRVSVG